VPSSTRIWRVAFNSHTEDVACATVVNIKATPADLVTTPSAETVADNIVDWLASPYRAMLSTRDLLLGATYNMDLQICAWAKTKTNAAVRGGHGGFFGTPAVDEAAFGGTHGQIATGNAYYLAVRAFADALLAGHDMGVLGADGHLSYVIYSRTRRFRGDDQYYFDGQSVTIDLRPHFLRSRKS
jgi:hypothetical protein